MSTTITDSDALDQADMARLQAGHEAALNDLMSRHATPLFHFLCRLTGNEDDANDLAQETFVRVFKSCKSFRSGARFSTWLFTIARNLCLNEIRRRGRHPADSLDETQVQHEDQPQKQYEDKNVALPVDTLLHGELAEKIEEALAALPENQRSALLMCRQEELSYEEIAEILGCSLPATKSLIHRGRETLKEKLKPYLQSGDWKTRI